MAKYKCKKCNIEKEIPKSTIVLRDGEWVTKESLCDCGDYMKQIITEEYTGMPTIVRNE